MVMIVVSKFDVDLRLFLDTQATQPRPLVCTVSIVNYETCSFFGFHFLEFYFSFLISFVVVVVLNDNMSSSHHSFANTMEEGATSSELLVGSNEPRVAMEASDPRGHITTPEHASSNNSNSRRGLFAADQTREMLICVIFFGISWIPHLFSPHERPIPYQYLEDSNEYVRNLDHDEQYVGDTISNVALILLAAVVPLALQLTLSILGKDCNAIHATICVYFTAFGLNALATESVKLYVGYVP